MSPITEKLERKLKEWPPEKARLVEQQVSALIAEADAEANRPKRTPPGERDPFFADTDFWTGPVPKDSSENHDKYLYGDEE